MRKDVSGGLCLLLYVIIIKNINSVSSYLYNALNDPIYKLQCSKEKFTN